MKAKESLLLFFAASLTACGIFDPGTDSVQLRVLNNSDHDFNNVVVNSVNLGDVVKYQFSDYEVLEKAYHYGAVSLDIDGKQFQIRPIDYVGETPLKNGHYTYMLSVDFEAGRLLLTFFKGNNVPGNRQPDNLTRIIETTTTYKATSGIECVDGSIAIAGTKLTEKRINPTVSQAVGTEVRYLPDAIIYVATNERLMAKADKAGNPIWLTPIESEINYYDDRTVIAESRDGGLIIAGSGEVQTDDQRYDMSGFVIKTDGLGNRQWLNIYGLGVSSRILSIQPSRAGGFILSGYQERSTWLLKIDESGNEEWQTRLSTEYHGESILENHDGFVVAGGRFGDTSETATSGLTKADIMGNEIWITKLENSLRSVIQASDGSFVVAGSADYSTGILLKLDPDGTLLWRRELPSGTRGFSVVQSLDGGFVVSGLMGESNTLFKTDSNGLFVWSKTLGSAAFNVHSVLNTVLATSDGNLLFIGSSATKIFLAKVDLQSEVLFISEIGK